MRFVTLDDHGEFRLTKDLLGAQTPSYAILSHTWGQDEEEVTFKDLMEGTGREKAGYDKIHFCARQAQRDGLKYFWIDTCCIDKTNNVELAEAIISMFRWYQKADRCYVYLTDVWASSPAAGSQLSRQPWESDFYASKWFTRGWTLQELLAPATVQFFAKDGRLLGDKVSLRPHIQAITSIAAPALSGHPLACFSVDERFAWANNRQTTREEDWAYSLLGIFGVFISPLYGEGKANAARRLRKEIDEVTRVEEVPARLSNGYSISFSLSNVVDAKRFVAREEELTRLHDELWQGDGQRIAVVCGLGGMGKTQLAVEYAKRHRSDYSSVFWLNARDETTLKEGFARMGERILREHPSVVYIKNAVHNRAINQIVTAVKQWLDEVKNSRWLIVYDNYDNASLDKTRSREWNGMANDTVNEMNAVSQYYDIRPYFPEAYHGAILVTTRSFQINIGHRIALGKLTDLEDNLKILAYSSGRQDLRNGT